MFNLSESLIVVIAVVTLMVISIPSLFMIYFMKKKINEQSRLLFSILRNNNTYNDILYDTSKNVQDMSENISTLQKSVSSQIIREMEKEKKKIMPTPELADMISKTIEEQITFEMSMMNNVRIIDKDTITRITFNVARTYPYVDETYLGKKCLSMINLIHPTKED